VSCTPEAARTVANLALSAEFLVDGTGAIRWVKLTDDVRVRARPEEVLKVVDELAEPVETSYRSGRP
jgi:peroxiredoxin